MPCVGGNCTPVGLEGPDMGWATEYATKVAGLPGFLAGSGAGGLAGGVLGHLAGGPGGKLAPTLAGAALGAGIGGYLGGAESPADHLEARSPERVAPYAGAGIGAGLGFGAGRLLDHYRGGNLTPLTTVTGAVLGGSYGMVRKQNEEARQEAEAQRAFEAAPRPAARPVAAHASSNVLQFPGLAGDEYDREMLRQELENRVLKSAAFGGRAAALEDLSDEHRLTTDEMAYVERGTRPSGMSTLGKALTIGAVGIPTALLTDKWTGNRGGNALRVLGSSAAGSAPVRGFADFLGRSSQLASAKAGLDSSIRKAVSGRQWSLNPVLRKFPLSANPAAAVRHLLVPASLGVGAGMMAARHMSKAKQEREGERLLRQVPPRSGSLSYMER